MSNKTLEIDVLIKQLHVISVNLKKAPFRRYLKSTVNKKFKLIKQLYKEITSKLVLYEEEIEPDHLNFLIKAARLEYNEIHQALSAKLTDYSSNLSFKSVVWAIIFKIRLLKFRKERQTKMADTPIAEIIKITAQLIPQYDGSVDKLPSVVAALTALNTLVTDANRVAAIQVVLSRLEGKARMAVGDNPATIDEITNKLKEKCDKRSQPETVVAKLDATKQTGSINLFAQQIEALTVELEKCYLAENIPVGAATNLAMRAGIKALTAGVRHKDTKLILKAGQFSTLASAVAKAVEHEPREENQTTPQVLYTRRGGFQSRGRGNNHHSRGRGNFHGRPSYRGNFQNYYNNGPQNTGYQNHQNYNPNSQNTSHYRGNGRGRGRGMNHTTYYAQTQNAPQQMNMSYQQIPPQQIAPAQPDVQQTQMIANNGNVHPLGIPLGQHIQ